MRTEWNEITDPAKLKEAIGSLSKSQLRNMGSLLGARVRVVFDGEEFLRDRQVLLGKIQKAVGRERLI